MDFSNLKVLVLGDVCLDIVQEGRSTRLSPEAPVPVILNPTENYSLGMAANVLSNLINLGADVDFAFIIGADYYGKIFNELINEHLKHTDNKARYTEHKIEIEKEIKTIVKKRIFSNNQQVARVDYEYEFDGVHVANRIVKYLEEKIADGIYYDAVIISDYNKGIITDFTWRHIKPLLEELSDNFFVDTKKLNVLDYFKGMIIFPNTKEINDIMSYNKITKKSELKERLGSQFIVETASENGAYIYDDEVTHLLAYKENVIDICGCGDTFLSAFILYYLKFKSKNNAADFANYCASKVSQKVGTSSIYLNEVVDYIKRWEFKKRGGY